jgi:CubicO group peptidase (beta-lactamase class C family)
MKRSLVQRKLARVDRALDRAIEKAEIPGAVVLARMRRDGEVLEHLSVRGLAVVRPERIPMTRETIFDLASLTKPLATTTATLLLVAEGAIGLDDPVVKHLPSFAERDKEAVTIRHLLTHSSGLRPWRPFHELMLERERSRGERLVATLQQPSTVISTSLCWGRWSRPWHASPSTGSATSASFGPSAWSRPVSCRSRRAVEPPRIVCGAASPPPRTVPGAAASCGARYTIRTHR